MFCSLIRSNLSTRSSLKASSILSKLPSSIVLHETILDALHSKQPIVALESTIITHGLPSNDDSALPTNLKCALDLEKTVRENGGVPATIALLDGKAHVGLNQDQLKRLAASPHESTIKPIKVGERDISNILAMGKGVVGGTTVSATLFLAAQIGASAFATGGLGGVHRGAETSMDISADLTALSRHPVPIFCSGAKSILDIPRTLEYLETLGVPVSTFSKSGHFPAFYTSSSGCKVNQIDSISQAARIILEQERLYKGFSSTSPSHVFGVPIPSSFEKEGLEIQKAVERAVEESKENGMDKKGKEVTPWLLQRVNEMTGSKSLKSNLALILNNTKVASQVVVEVENLRKEWDQENGRQSFRGVDFNRVEIKQSESQQGRILVFGLAAVDLTSQFQKLDSQTKSFDEATTYPGKVRMALGGVGRNVAEASHRLLHSSALGKPITTLVAPIGTDHFFSEVLRLGLLTKGMRIDGLFELQSLEEERNATPVCSLLLNSDGDLINGVADMNASEGLNPNIVSETFEKVQVQDSRLTVVMDGNLSVESMVQILKEVSRLREIGRPPILLFEPTSLSKSSRLLKAFSKLPSSIKSRDSLLTLSTPNEIELLRLYEHAQSVELISSSSCKLSSEKEKELKQQAIAFNLKIKTLEAAEILSKSGFLGSLILVKLGSRGVLSVRRLGNQEVEFKLHPIPKVLPTDSELNTTGAGDSFAGAVLGSAHLIGSSPSEWDQGLLEGVVRIGQKASALTLLSSEAVSEEIESLGGELKELCQMF